MKKNLNQSRLSKSISQGTEPSFYHHPFQPMPSYSFSRANKISEHTLILPQVSDGPAKYNISERSSKPSMRFEKYSARHYFTSQTDVPAPNAYDLPRPKGHTRVLYRQESGLRRQTKTVAAQPGPGYYELGQTGSSIGGLISASVREIKYDTGVPGVGRYECSTPSSRKAVPFTTKASSSRLILPSPGPASYKPQRAHLNQGVKISTSRRKWDYLGHGFASCVPGPGSYATQMQPPKPKKQPLPVRPRQTNSISQSQQALGNTSRQSIKGTFEDYNPYIIATKRASIQVNFPKSRRNDDFLDVFGAKQLGPRSPGPAVYGFVRSMNQIVIAEPSSKSGIAFPQSKRLDPAIKKDVSPGVGQYSSASVFGKVYKKPTKKVQQRQFQLKDFSTFEDM